MAESRLRAVVVGSGIGGLAAGLALQDRFEVSIVDPSGRAGGAMGEHHHVTLWPNGCAALDALGIRPEKLGTAIARFEHRTAAGDPIWRLDTDDLPGGSARTRQVRLADLREAVRDALAPSVAPRAPSGDAWPRPHAGDYRGYFDRFFDDGEQVRVWAKSGPEAPPDVELVADLLIGAAGKRDAVRAQLLADDPVRAIDQTLFVGWLSSRRDAADALDRGLWAEPRDDAPTRIIGFVGDGAWIDVANVRGGYFWIAAMRGADRTVGALREQLEGFHADVRALVDHSDWALDPDGKLSEKKNQTKPGWPMRDVMPPGRSTRGGVGLLGDSCHGVTLVLGQSVGLALEDAAVLQDVMARGLRELRPTIVGQRVQAREALARYGRRRLARPALVNHISHVLPQIALSEHLPAHVRDAIDRVAMPVMTRVVGETLFRFDPKRPV